MTIFVLDTNVISDIAAPKPDANVVSNLALHRHDALYLCRAVDYEIRRGLLKNNAIVQLTRYEQSIKPWFIWVSIADEDWNQSALLWSTTVSAGRQLSDIDLLIAALTLRLNGTLVTADDDFDALPISRVNWRL
jgi:predicted nucleic acid-binding protein